MNKREENHQPLRDLRVIECGQGVSTAFAAKLMADLGAEVIKIEPPGGDVTRQRGPFQQDRSDPEKSGLFIYLNCNKLGITLDLARPAGQDILHQLLRCSDLLVHNVAPSQRAGVGLETRVLRAKFPQLVIGATSPFGDSGPYRDWKAYEINLENAGGWAFLNPGSSTDAELPPLKSFGSQAEFQAGLHLCFAALATFWGRMRTGEGKHVEVSEQECIAAMLELSFVHYTYTGRLASRLGRRAVAPWSILKCADGYVMLLCLEEDQWRRLVEMMGDPEWAHEDIFATGASRGLHCDALYALMEDWIRGWKTREFFLEAQRRRIPVAPVSSMRDLYADEHLADRHYFVPVAFSDGATVQMPAAPFKSTADGWGIKRPAPLLRQNPGSLLDRLPIAPIAERAADLAAGIANTLVRTGEKPLSGIRVLDLTWVWAGPYATLQLAHMGAEIIRVESQRRLCATRRVPPFADGIAGFNRAGYFNQYNLGKRSFLLNLSCPEGVSLALDLVKHCDVVADNFSAGAMRRMGLGYEQLRAVKPDIIAVSISGFGQTGPWRNFLSYGPTAAAFAGFFSLTGYEGKGPAEAGISFSDPTAGMLGAIAVLAALFHRARTGQGQYIDVSQLEATLALLPEGLLECALNGREPERRGNRDPLMAPHNCYKTRGGENEWVSIAVATDVEWRALCDAMARPELADDPRFASAVLRKRNEEALDRILLQWTRTRDRWEITELLQNRGVAAFPSMSNEDLAQDRHLNEGGFLVRPDHPEVGRRMHAGIPWRIDGIRTEVTAAPLLGADTDDILRNLIGLSADEIRSLRANDVIV